MSANDSRQNQGPDHQQEQRGPQRSDAPLPKITPTSAIPLGTRQHVPPPQRPRPGTQVPAQQRRPQSGVMPSQQPASPPPPPITPSQAAGQRGSQYTPAGHRPPPKPGEQRPRPQTQPPLTRPQTMPMGSTRAAGPAYVRPQSGVKAPPRPATGVPQSNPVRPPSGLQPPQPGPPPKQAGPPPQQAGPPRPQTEFPQKTRPASAINPPRQAPLPRPRPVTGPMAATRPIQRQNPQNRPVITNLRQGPRTADKGPTIGKKYKNVRLLFILSLWALAVIIILIVANVVYN